MAGRAFFSASLSFHSATDIGIPSSTNSSRKRSAGSPRLAAGFGVAGGVFSRAEVDALGGLIFLDFLEVLERRVEAEEGAGVEGEVIFGYGVQQLTVVKALIFKGPCRGPVIFLAR